MALDREKALADAERLLKGGKAQSALEELRKLAEESARDAVVLNRIGDLVARFGFNGDAVSYYHRSADVLARSGFYPKAIAVAKKIHKIDPARVETLVQLGELYLRQRLGTEARAYLVQAADQYRKAKQLAKAREVHERIVQIDPEDHAQRAILADLRAAEGDRPRAGREYAELAQLLGRIDRHDDAERAWKRAAEFLPASAEILAGLAGCLSARGRHEEAIAVLETAIAEGADNPSLAGELFVLLELAGFDDRASAFLDTPLADTLPVEAIERGMRHALRHDRADGAWSRLDALLGRWGTQGRGVRAVAVLERLATIHPKGYVPALERLVVRRRRAGDPAALARAIETTLAACRSQGMVQRADELAEELARVDPSPPSPGAGPAAKPPAPEGAKPRETPAPRARDKEAPAVPVTPADHEMVAGAMTEAEVFQKYGLEAEALAQLRRIAERFPGFVPAQEKLVQVLYAGSDRGALQRTLVALAMARRAAGHLAGARKAALEAEEIGPLGEEARRGLEESGLLAGSGAATTPAAASVAPSKPAPPERIAPKAASPPPAPPPASELVIEFEEEVETPEPEPEPVQEVEAPAAASVPADPLRLDEEDLFSITEALERDLAPEGEEDAPQVDREKTLEEVVDQFRKHVEEEVGRDDFRTHYDLGIAYKEMGLLDEALEAFRIATGAPSLYRDACSMLALCCRERGDLPAAVDWYERALDAPDPADDLSGLRYDLAEVLVEAGDERRAYEIFRAIAETAPAYRDARGRADALRTRLGG